MATVINLDGDLVPPAEATVSVFDRGFLYGDSVYEVVRTYGRHPFELDAHLARLASAALTLFIPLVLARMMPQADYGTYKLLFLVSMTATAVLPLGVAQSLYFFVPRAREPRV